MHWRGGFPPLLFGAAREAHPRTWNPVANMMLYYIIWDMRTGRATMNYKILALSTVIGVGVITIGLMEAQKPGPRDEVEHLTTADIEEPETQFAISEAMS